MSTDTGDHMEIKILEEKKNRLVFVIEGDRHTYTNALRSELAADKHVTVAGYHIEHPLAGNPKFVVETEGANAKEVVTEALKRLSKQASKLASEAKELK